MSQVWLVLAVIAGVAVLALLHFMAAGLKDVTYIHDMRVKMATLRKERLDRLNALASKEIVEVGEVEEEEHKAAA